MQHAVRKIAVNVDQSFISLPGKKVPENEVKMKGQKSRNVEAIKCERGAMIYLTGPLDGAREFSCKKLRMMFVPGHAWLKCGDEDTLVCLYNDDWNSQKIKVFFPR